MKKANLKGLKKGKDSLIHQFKLHRSTSQKNSRAAYGGQNKRSNTEKRLKTQSNGSVHNPFFPSTEKNSRYDKLLRTYLLIESEFKVPPSYMGKRLNCLEQASRTRTNFVLKNAPKRLRLNSFIKKKDWQKALNHSIRTRSSQKRKFNRKFFNTSNLNQSLIQNSESTSKPSNSQNASKSTHKDGKTSQEEKDQFSSSILQVEDLDSAILIEETQQMRQGQNLGLSEDLSHAAAGENPNSSGSMMDGSSSTNRKKFKNEDFGRYTMRTYTSRTNDKGNYLPPFNLPKNYVVNNQNFNEYYKWLEFEDIQLEGSSNRSRSMLEEGDEELDGSDSGQDREGDDSIMVGLHDPNRTNSSIDKESSSERRLRRRRKLKRKRLRTPHHNSKNKKRSRQFSHKQSHRNILSTKKTSSSKSKGDRTSKISPKTHSPAKTDENSKELRERLRTLMGSQRTDTEQTNLTAILENDLNDNYDQNYAHVRIEDYLDDDKRSRKYKVKYRNIGGKRRSGSGQGKQDGNRGSQDAYKQMLSAFRKNSSPKRVPVSFKAVINNFLLNYCNFHDF